MNGDQWPAVTVYSTRYCVDCRQSKAVLERLGVPYREVDIDDDPAAADEVQRLNRGYRSVPTIIIGEGTVLTEPSARRLTEALRAAAE